MTHQSVIPIVMALLLVLGGCSTHSAQDSESPDSAFLAYKQAMEKQEWATAFSLLSPESKDFVIFELVFTSGMGMDPELEAICYNYLDETKLDAYSDESEGKNLTINQRRHEIASCIDDQSGFYTEAMIHMAKMKATLLALGEFRVKQKGSSAVIYCQVTESVSHMEGADNEPMTEQYTKERPFHLNKVDGRWFITIPGTNQSNKATD